VAVLANGHLLIEGVPGLAKTTTVKVLSQIVHAKFQRIQFTPDLLPSDLIGTLVYEPQGGHFVTKKGPIFANIILADEINRAPAKVQSALLEAMEERQVTIGENTFKLDDLFLVMATENPIEQEGTYPLPEAQLDRFMLKVNMTYPTVEEERLILQRRGTSCRAVTLSPVITAEEIFRARSVLDQVLMDDKIAKYILDLVFATRYPERYNLGDLNKLIQYGASGLPSVSHPIGVSGDIIEDGENGFLRRDAEGWREAIERLIADAALRRRMGKKARAVVEERYSLAAWGPRVADLVDGL
jgi:MoxR-like ATPase